MSTMSNSTSSSSSEEQAHDGPCETNQNEPENESEEQSTKCYTTTRYETTITLHGASRKAAIFRKNAKQFHDEIICKKNKRLKMDIEVSEGELEDENCEETVKTIPIKKFVISSRIINEDGNVIKVKKSAK